jgi:SET domain-containing protein
MPAKHHVPRVNPKFACYKLRIRHSRIERFGVFTKETIPMGNRVTQYTGERISEREATRRARRAISMLNRGVFTRFA